MEGLTAWVEAVPDPVVYLVLGLGAAVENVFPALPADTFVVLGGFISVTSGLSATWVFLATWSLNIASALAMYRVGHTHARPFFEGGWGRHVLNARQMDRMRVFFRRWGTPAILFARFLPGVRSVVPVFAGVTHLRFWSVAPPIAVASAVWYGFLVWLGTFAGRNLDVVLERLRNVNGWLLGAALTVTAAAVLWWWNTRHHHDDHE